MLPVQKIPHGGGASPQLTQEADAQDEVAVEDSATASEDKTSGGDSAQDDALTGQGNELATSPEARVESGSEELNALSDSLVPLAATQIGTSATYWEVTDNSDTTSTGATGKTLTITGTGAMVMAKPWETAANGAAVNRITQVVFADGITKTYPSGFANYTELTGVTLGTTFTEIADSTFSGCTRLEDDDVNPILSKVTVVGGNAFTGCTGLKNIVFGDQITTAAGLNDCTGLKSVDLGNGVTTTAMNLFYRCSNLESVTFGTQLKTIGAGTFQGCSSLPDEIANNVLAQATSLGGSSFYGCTTLENIIVGAQVAGTAPASLFYNCTGLETVVINAQYTSLGTSSFQGCTNLETVTLPNTITSLGTSVFQGCAKLKQASAEPILAQVTTIGNSAFYGCELLTDVTLRAELTNTPTSVFYGCTGLLSATINSASLGNNAFYNCTQLASVTLGSGFLGTSSATIGTSAFRGCESLPGSVATAILDKFGTVSSSKTTPTNLFQDCKSLDAVTIGANVEGLGNNTFYRCSKLVDVSLANGSKLKTLGSSVFSECTVLEDDYAQAILDKVTTIGVGTFNGCAALVDITIGSQIPNTTALPGSLFQNCTSLSPASAQDILDRFKTLGASTFAGCTALTGITLGDQTNLPDYLFKDCTSLTGDDIGAMVEDPALTLGQGVFSGCPGLANITWPVTRTTLPAYFFQNCTALTSGKANDVLSKVTTIGAGAFEGCTGLTNVVIGSNITALPAYLFRNCTSLTDWTANKILERFATVGDYTFTGCTSLKNIVLGNQLTAIPRWLFQNCAGLTSVDLSNSNNIAGTFGSYAFDGCDKLKTIDLSKTQITNIDSGAFRGCSLLESVSLPDTLTQISGGYGAFENCTALQSITIPAKVATIWTGAFKGCTGLQGAGAVTILNPEKCTIQAGAFEGTGLNTPESVVMSYETITALPEFLNNSLAEASRAFPAGLLVSNTSNGFTTIGDILTGVASDASDITLPVGVKAIGPDAFRDHTNLVSVQGMEQIEFIGTNAFNNCPALKKITIPAAVTKLLDGTFRDCSALEEIDIQGELSLYNDTMNRGAILPYPRFMQIPEGVVSIKTERNSYVATRPSTAVGYPTVVLPSTLKYAGGMFPNSTSQPYIFANPNKELVIARPFLVDGSNYIGGLRTIHGAYTQAVFDGIKNDTKDSVAPTIEPHQIAPGTITEVSVGTKLVDVDCTADYCFFDTTGKDLDIVTVAAAAQEQTNTNFASAVPAGSVLAGYDISWVEKNGFSGDARQDGTYERTGDVGTLRVSLPADAKYNGQTATILKYNASAAGTPEDPYVSTIGTALVSSGSLTFDTTELGSFAVAYQVGVSGVSLNLSVKTIEAGKSFDLVANVAPASASNKAVSWTSSNNVVATVDTSGKVSAKAAGTANITVKTADGNKTAVCKVTVKAAVPAAVFAGDDRYQTASKVALEAYPDGAAGVILAAGSGTDKINGKYADALSASALAGLLDYPIVLTEKDDISTHTLGTIKTLNPKEIIVLGDEQSISDAVRAKLPKTAKITPIFGANRFATAVEVYNYGKDKNGGWAKTAIFAFGKNFPDALAIAPLSANKHFPIFLVEGEKIGSEVKAVFTKANFTDAIIVGDSQSVKDGIAKDIKSILGKDATRLGGKDRYQTATKIIEYSVKQGLSYDGAGIATGQNFPDALTGGPLLAKNGSVLLIAHDGNTTTLDLLKGKSEVKKVHILGGLPSVSQKVRTVIETNLGWKAGTIK